MKIHGNARTCPRGRLLIVRRVEAGWMLAETAAAAGVSVRTVSKWLRCYRLEGDSGLLDRSSAPRSIPHRTAAAQVEAIAALLADHGVLASCGSVGDAYDNALAESFVDTIKTELIRDRVWRTQSQLEPAIVAYIGWYNHDRLHEALGDLPPAEYETLALTATLRD